MFIQKGGYIRGVSDISYPYIDAVREHLDIGKDVRHYDQYEGIIFLVGDKIESISSIVVDAESLSIDGSAMAFRTDDPTYAEHLISTFEPLWEQAAPQHSAWKSC